MGRQKVFRDESDVEFGARLRALRHQRGLTLVQLAAACDLSHSFLSQMERGKARPSLGSLAGIARALECPVSQLLGPPSHPDEPTLVRADEAERFEFIPGGPTARRLNGPGRTIVALLIEGRIGWTDELAHEGRELFYVIEGTLEIEVGDRRHRLNPGDAIRFPGPVPHREASPAGSRLLNLVAEKTLTGIGDDYERRLASANPDVARTLTADLPEQVGPCLRHFRRERGLTLQELAAATGLSHPFLSQVERGRAHLSVESQKRVAAALRIAPLDLWVQHGRGEVYVARGARAPVDLLSDDPTASTHARRLSASGPVFRLADVFGGLAEYGATDETADGWEVMVHVLCGSLDTRVGRREYRLGRGDTLAFDGASPYSVRRHGDDDPRWLHILALTTV